MLKAGHGLQNEGRCADQDGDNDESRDHLRKNRVSKMAQQESKKTVQAFWSPVKNPSKSKPLSLLGNAQHRPRPGKSTCTNPWSLASKLSLVELLAASAAGCGLATSSFLPK